MKYAIYLDDVESEVFETDEDSAIVKYNETLEEFKGEDIYEKIELVRFEVIKEDLL